MNKKIKSSASFGIHTIPRSTKFRFWVQLDATVNELYHKNKQTKNRLYHFVPITLIIPVWDCFNYQSNVIM